MKRLAALIALAAAPALAQFPDRPPSLEGIYAAIGGGGQLMIAGDNGFGYDAEARLGYSFGPATGVFLSGAIDGAIVSGISTKSIQVAAFLQYHLAASRNVMVYTRAGIGLGLVPSFYLDQTGAGLAAAGGLGLEIRVGEGVYLGPELFYRRATVSVSGASGDVQVIGLQLNLVYY